MIPPSAERRPHQRTLHGETVEDAYFWLRDREDPAVVDYLQVENAYTAAVMEPTTGLQQEIFDEIKRRTQETDMDVPARRGAFFYATRTEEGKDYRIWVRMSGSPAGPVEVMLDENAAAEGSDYFRLGNLAVSPDETSAAYTVDLDGSERYRLRFRDIESGTDLEEEVPLCSYGLAWSSDSGHIFYSVPDEAMRPWQIWRHRLGSDPATDTLVLQEDDERFYLGVHRTRSGSFVLIEAESATTSETWAIPGEAPDPVPRSVLPRSDGVEYAVDHRGPAFWVVTNDGATDGKLIRLPIDGGTATEVISHEAGVKLSFADCFAGHVVVWGRRGGLPAALLIVEGDAPRYLEMPEPVYQVGPGKNYEFEATSLRYRYESPITPLSIFDQDIASGERTLLRQTPVLGGFNSEEYSTERVWGQAADGAAIPLSVVYHRDTPIDGSAPLVVYAYGAYETSIPAGFSIPRLSLLDRGAVYAVAHVRGGGEMGRAWYEAGRMENKPNTFSDLIDATRHLVGGGYGDPGRLATRGGSAGGLTVGAALNLRPDLYRAAVLQVPFVDVVNTMLDGSLPLTVVEWEEWGNPKLPEQYAWLRSYAPYENLEEAEYPALLVTAGLNDPRVSYWEPAKWVAKLRTADTGDRPILLKTEMGAGHFARSGRYDIWRDEAFTLAFLLRQLDAA